MAAGHQKLGERPGQSPHSPQKQPTCQHLRSQTSSLQNQETNFVVSVTQFPGSCYDSPMKPMKFFKDFHVLPSSAFGFLPGQLPQWQQWFQQIPGLIPRHIPSHLPTRGTVCSQRRRMKLFPRIPRKYLLTFICPDQTMCLSWSQSQWSEEYKMLIDPSP